MMLIMHTGMLGDCRALMVIGCIAIFDCWQLLSHASNSRNQCSQAAALCTQAEQLGVGYVHRRLINTMGKCIILTKIWARASVNNDASSVWQDQICSSLTLAIVYLVTTTVKVSKSRHSENLVNEFGSVRMSSCNCIATFVALFIVVTERITMQNNTQTNTMVTVCLCGSVHCGIMKHLMFTHALFATYLIT